MLIVDGQSNHNYAVLTAFVKDRLEKSGFFMVEVSTSPPAPGKTPDQAETDRLKKSWSDWRPNFKGARVVILNYNGESWPDEVKKNFEEFIRDGGGAMVVHSANKAFPEWNEFNRMIGLGWRDAKLGARVYYDEKDELVRVAAGEGPGAGHGPSREYRVVSRNPEHPIMKALPSTWMHVQDELYHGQRGPAENMTILASALDDKAKNGTGVHEPVLWVVPYGKGACVTCAMGHVMGNESGKALRCVGFVTILLRSCEWLATGKVTTGVPADFPTPDATSSIRE